MVEIRRKILRYDHRVLALWEGGAHAIKMEANPVARKTLPSAPSTEDVMTLADILKPANTLPTHDALRA